MRHESVSENTEKILLDVIKYLEEEPLRLQMTVWGELIPEGEKRVRVQIGGGVGIKYQDKPPCGTVSCLAGTVLLTTESGKDYLKKHSSYFETKLETGKNINSYIIEFPNNTSDVARFILGITQDQARSLFYFKSWRGYGWPEEFEDAYTDAETAEERVAATKRRVNHFIETGE